jgi:hypothetical protein
MAEEPREVFGDAAIPGAQVPDYACFEGNSEEYGLSVRMYRPAPHSSVGRGDKGKTLGMLNPLHVQIDIDVRPVEVLRRDFMYIEDLFRGSISKPWEPIVVEKEFLVMVGKPNPVTGQLNHLNRRNDGSRHG